jgi:hypothetical protein
MMTRPLALLPAVLLALGLGTGDASAAAESEIAVAEVATPPASSGVDRATLKSAAEGEIRRLDGSRARGRRVLVSVALVQGSDAPVAFTVNATLREARTGNIFAVVEGRARGEGAASRDLNKQVAHAAVRSAVRQIPAALK